MKKLFLFFISLVTCNSIVAQNPTYQQKLFYTCKIWGFVKYYHSEVSTCQVNWDSVLVADLPLVKNAVTQNDFNDALDTMLNAAGPMAIATTNPPAPLPPELMRNLNFNWISNPLLRNDVQVILDTIKNNFRPHTNCWVQDNQYTNSYGGWLVFPHDSLMLPNNISSSFPDEWHRGLLLFKYWNIMNYFNPYDYVWDNSTDSILYNNDSLVVSAPTPALFFLQFKMISANLNDVHVEGLTWSSTETYPDGYYFGPELKLKYIPGKYVVVKSGVTNISNGDEIVSINGLIPTQWEDSLRPYISAGNLSVFRREVAKDMLCGPYNSAITMITKDSLGVNHTTVRPRVFDIYTAWFSSYYPNDTLATTTWKYWNCNIGYVNMGQLQSSDVNTMYGSLQNTSAIIFDIRNYPNGTAWPIADLMYPNHTMFSQDMTPDVTYPGTFYWYDDYLGYNANSTPYYGKVIVLMNEETQSQAEYSCMILDAMPDVVNVGSQTAGTDGNITYFRLSPDVHAGFTTLGIYYPNGDSTERIGIVPDSLIYPTQTGIRHHRDEVLEKALEIAQCWTSVENIPNEKSSLTIYPNPSTGMFIIQNQNINSEMNLEIYNSLGEKIYSRKIISENPDSNREEIDLSNEANGIYFVKVNSENNSFTQKIIIQK